MRYTIMKARSNEGSSFIDVVFNSPVDVEISDDVMMFLDTQTFPHLPRCDQGSRQIIYPRIP